MRFPRALALLATTAAAVLLATPTATAAPARTAEVAPTAVTSVVPISSPGATFRIVNNQNQTRCIGISNGIAGLWNCTRNRDQTWRWVGTGVYKALVNGNNQCLAVKGGSTSPGAIILGYGDCRGQLDQYWKASSGALWSYLENAKAPHNIVAVKGGITPDGQPLVLWGKRGNPDQFWAAAP